MTDNPFTKETFETIWLKHFKGSVPSVQFKSIQPVKFYKDKFFPLYVNVGRNITNGISYELNPDETDFRGKTFLIYDVPEYYEIKTSQSKDLKVKASSQFRGYLCDLRGFDSFEDYFRSVLKKSKNRGKLRRHIKALEACFDVEYKFYQDNITKEEYDLVFNQMISLISRRFGSLGLDNNIVAKKDYYYDLCYQLLKKKQAVFFVNYADNKPIGISFMFKSKNHLFYSITTFDVDFVRYNLGHITIIRLLEWSFDNGIEYFDFSKGEYDYKKRWSNKQYRFESHILYDSKSIKSKIVANLTFWFFEFKQYLRDRRVNFLYNRIKFFFKSNSSKDDSATNNVQIIELNNQELDLDSLEQISIENPNYWFLKEPIFSYLYTNSEKFKNLKFYKKKGAEPTFYAIGKKTRLQLY